MKTLLHDFKTSFLLTAVLSLVLCGIYPLAVWAGAQVLFPAQANGSLLLDSKGTVRGSRLLGQPFASARPFLPRPSAAGAGYDAANSSGTNLGPTSRKLSDSIQAAVKTYRSFNDVPPETSVPADAVTSSASGLDPHISVQNAQLQAPRVARERGLAVEKVLSLVAANTAQRDLGILGEPSVNVLLLNSALDKISG